MENLLQPEVIWFLLGAVLIALEFASTGIVLVFFGIGALITAIFTLLLSPGLEIQLIVFSATSLAGLAFLRRLLKEKLFGKPREPRDTLEEEFAGKVGTALEPIPENGHGKVSFKGSTWPATSMSEIKEGEEVVIISKESITLHVEPKT